MMGTITGILLKRTLSAATCIAILAGGASPAFAREHNARAATERGTSAPAARSYSAPRAERAPRADYARMAPRERYVQTAPRERYVQTAPRERYVQTAPRERYVQTAPRERYVQSAPRERYVQSAPRERYVQSAPRERYVHSAPRERYVQSAPRERFVQRAPRVEAAPRERYVQTAPRERFVQRAPRARYVETAPRIRYVQAAPRERFLRRTPFEQIVRMPARTRFVTTREVVRSPLMRSLYIRRHRTAIAYHPAYFVGRVMSVNRQRILLQPPVGREIVVRDVALQQPLTYIRPGSYVTLPVTYYNGGYSLYNQPTYMGYNYDTPTYCAPSSTAYAALLPTVINALSGNGGSINATDIAAIALSAAAGTSNSCSSYAPYTPYGGYAPAAQTYTYIPQNVPVAPDQYAYPATPYDNVTYNGVPYNGVPYDTAYTPYGAYAPQQVQGLVVAKSGSMLMLLGANGMQPIFVNAAPAMGNGFALNGPVAVGQFVDAVGFYNGDTFMATAVE